MDSLESLLPACVLKLEIPHLFSANHEENFNTPLGKDSSQPLRFWEVMAHDAILPLVYLDKVRDTQFPD